MKHIKKYRWILLLLILSTVLRIVLYLQIMNTTPHGDYFDYKEWIYRSYSLGFKELYERRVSFALINQPPGTIWILRGSYELFLQTAKAVTHVTKENAGATLWINDALLIFFFRLPSILADLLLGFCIYLAVKWKASKRTALFAAALFLLNPATIYNSTVWGQLDPINNLLFYLSLLFLIRKKPFLSVLFFLLSLFVKLSLLPLLPFYFLFAFSGYFFERKKFIISLVAVLGIITLLSLPYSQNPLWLFSFLVKASSGENPLVTVGAFNFWWLLFNPIAGVNPPEVSKIYFDLPLATWGYLLFGLFSTPLLLSTWIVIKKKRLTVDDIFLLTALVAFAAFLFLPKMHERYLYPALPLLITWVGLKNKFWMTAILLSIIHFLNLYLVWNPNLFLFGTFENILSSQLNRQLLSIVTMIIFTVFYLQLFLFRTSTSQKQKKLYKKQRQKLSVIQPKIY